MKIDSTRRRRPYIDRMFWESTFDSTRSIHVKENSEATVEFRPDEEKPKKSDQRLGWGKKSLKIGRIQWSEFRNLGKYDILNQVIILQHDEMKPMTMTEMKITHHQHNQKQRTAQLATNRRQRYRIGQIGCMLRGSLFLFWKDWKQPNILIKCI